MSIVDYLKSKGQDSSFEARSKLASDFGIENFSGTAEQNIQMENLLKSQENSNKIEQPKQDLGNNIPNQQNNSSNDGKFIIPGINDVKPNENIKNNTNNDLVNKNNNNQVKTNGLNNKIPDQANNKNEIILDNSNTQKKTNTYSTPKTISEWKTNTKSDKNALVDMIEERYGLDAMYDKKRNVITAIKDGKKYTWTFDEGGNPIKKIEDYKAPSTKDDAINQFNQLLQTGNENDIRSFIIDNKQYAKDFQPGYKSWLKQQEVNKKASKFNSMDGKGIYEAIKKGDLTPGTDVFNAVDPAVIESYNRYKKLALKVDIRNGEKLVADVSSNDFREVLYGMEGYLSNYDERVNAIVENEDRKKSRTKLDEVKSDLTKKQRELKNVRKKIEEKFPSASTTEINARVNKESSALIEQIEQLTDEYNVEYANYSMLESDMNIELNALNVEVQAEQQSYTMALNQYNTNQSLLRQDEQTALLEQNKKLALLKTDEDVKRVNNFQAQINKDGLKGEWKVTDSGLFFEETNGKITKVLENTNGKLTVNKDGTYTYVDVVNGKPVVQNYDLNGDLVIPGVKKTEGAISFKDKASKYQGEASFKNNNTAGITRGASSQDLKNAWAEAGITFSKGSARPGIEGGEYVSFDSLQGGVSAQIIALGRKSGSLEDALMSWVGYCKTKECLAKRPTYTKANAKKYAESIFNDANKDGSLSEGGLTLKSSMSSINEGYPSALRKVVTSQIKRESPDMYREMASEGYIRNGTINLPPLGVSETDKNSKKEVLGWTGVPVSYQSVVLGNVSFAKISDKERPIIQKEVQDMYNGGIPAEDGMLIKAGYNVDALKSDNRPVVDKFVGISKYMNDDDLLENLSYFVNRGDMIGAVKTAENVADDKIKKVYGSDAIFKGNVIDHRNKTNDLLELINEHRDEIGIANSKFSDLEKTFTNKEDYQEIKTRLSSLLADQRRKFAGTAVTDSELKALEDFIGLKTSMNVDNLIRALETNLQNVGVGYNSQRIGVGLPELDVNAVGDWDATLQAYKGGSMTDYDRFKMKKGIEKESNIGAMGVGLSSYIGTLKK